MYDLHPSGFFMSTLLVYAPFSFGCAPILAGFAPFFVFSAPLFSRKRKKAWSAVNRAFQTFF
jgi:hypothetical protein